MEFSRQEYSSGLPFPSPEDLPGPGIELSAPAASPALQAGSSLPSYCRSQCESEQLLCPIQGGKFTTILTREAEGGRSVFGQRL